MEPVQWCNGSIDIKFAINSDYLFLLICWRPFCLRQWTFVLLIRSQINGSHGTKNKTIFGTRPFTVCFRSEIRTTSNMRSYHFSDANSCIQQNNLSILKSHHVRPTSDILHSSLFPGKNFPWLNHMPFTAQLFAPSDVTNLNYHYNYHNNQLWPWWPSKGRLPTIFPISGSTK